MPDFYIDNLDISPDDFVDACSDIEIDELVEKLLEDGYINNQSILKSNGTHSDEVYTKAIIKLSESRLRLTNEEEEIIKKIAEIL